MIRKDKMTPRPRRLRRVGYHPADVHLKPIGGRTFRSGESILTVDEFETIRLKDYLMLGQEEAAKKMDISQPTFHRLLLSARKKIADAIVNGKSIRIEGGDFMVRSGKGKGLGGGFALGPEGECICPKCETRSPHQTGQPCYEQKCPKCGTPMTRAR